MGLPAPGAPGRIRRGRRRIAGLAGIALLAGAVVGAVAVSLHRHRSSAPAPVLSTTTVARADLQTTASFKATVGFGATQLVTGNGKGTITSLPAAGATVRRGGTLYRVDDRPVILLYGAAPLYRSLGSPAPAGAALALQAAQAALLAAEQALTLAQNHNETPIGARQDQLTITVASAAVTNAQEKLQGDQAALSAAQDGCAVSPPGSQAAGGSPAAGTTAPGGNAGGCAAASTAAAAVSADQSALQRATEDLASAQLGIAAKQYVSPATLAQDQVAVAQAQSKVQADQAALDAASAAPTGPDVAMVASNLAALGDLPASESGTTTWTTALTEAVKHLQRSVGMDVTGTLNPAEVVVASGPARVAAVTAHVGSSASGPLLSLTGTTEVVSFTGTGDLHPGQTLTITPAGAAPVKGHITTVTPDGDHVDVQARPDHPAALPASATDSVTVVTADHPGVLSVPVEALLALAGGGYALQLPDGRLIPLTTGVISGDRIEVSGSGVHAGLRVVTAI